MPPFIGRDTEEGFSLVQMDKEGWLLNKYGLDSEDDEFYSLRKCKAILRSDFVAVCYCVIVGLQVRQFSLLTTIKSTLTVHFHFEGNSTWTLIENNRSYEIFAKTVAGINAFETNSKRQSTICAAQRMQNIIR